MSTYCEIVEDLVVGESSCPATDVILVQPAVGTGSSSVVVGVLLPALVGGAQAVSQVSPTAYAILLDAASCSNSASTTTRISLVASDLATGESRPVAEFNGTATSVGTVSGSSPEMFTEHVLASNAAATSVLVAGSQASTLLVAYATALSSSSPGQQENLTASASAISSCTARRNAYATPSETATAISIAFASDVPATLLLTSACQAVSAAEPQVAAAPYLAAVADAASDVWFKDPGRIAWVMNTETTAASWYDNFDFESIAQTPDKVLGVGPDGLYELVGGTDSGEQIDAETVSGFSDFGMPQTKRVDNMYFGYTSDGRISVTVETYGSDHIPTTYLLEQRAADAPRNSRVTPGKGMWGRYWRFTIKNVAGADFEVHDASVDIAASSRRI